MATTGLQTLWRRHPGLRTESDLTIGEPAADRLCDVTALAEGEQRPSPSP